MMTQLNQAYLAPYSLLLQTSPTISTGGLIPQTNGSNLNISQEMLGDLRHLVEGVLKDKEQLNDLLETDGEDVQLWLDVLQMIIELPDVTAELRSSILDMMLRFSKRSGLCPQHLIVENVRMLGDFPIIYGGFGDVWKGKIGEQVVHLRVLRTHVSDGPTLLKECMREAIVWWQLKHPNILPFMGMYYLDKARERPCLVSAWMERGNLVRYLKESPREQVDHSVYIGIHRSFYLHLQTNPSML
ncbi:hypothetical protein E1B28_011827 [Marasmius oreades]|uniref:Protein kinase domain-containing protein n=1 Tax=Marasmius oreades TaxID=181124 RepID=A0A9P7UQ06_9AGAR|nr:uncharacterized protein E1B28_011827 [Marasmius oreades]KAG7090227.1 hypothetical protein E1B28_011827 [Marasmius oreades]